MARKRQLQLPGMVRVARAPKLARAKRDLSAEAFDRAVARHGFRCRSGRVFIDDAGRRVEAMCRGNPIRIARRATLAKLLRAKREAI